MMRLGSGRKKTRFVLTPLVDIIFLLLVFFMLSSQIAPYSLLSIAQPATIVSGDNSQQSAATQPPPTNTTRSVTLQILKGHLRSGNKLISLEELGAAARAFKDANIEEVLLISTRSATVQDVITSLEMFKANDIGRVRLIANVSTF